MNPSHYHPLTGGVLLCALINCDKMLQCSVCDKVIIPSDGMIFDKSWKHHECNVPVTRGGKVRFKRGVTTDDGKVNLAGKFGKVEEIHAGFYFIYPDYDDEVPPVSCTRDQFEVVKS